MIVLIDNGHGHNTAGKKSPDGRLQEWSWTRDCAARVVESLTLSGVDARLLVKEANDVPLLTRVSRVNELCRKEGEQNVLLVSIHNNAAGADGKWYDARGWTVWVCKNASKRSQRLAQLLYAEAAQAGLKGNRYVPACHYWQSDLYILKHTLCPAVLTENLFQDNKLDVDYLLSAQGMERIAQLHADGIKRFLGLET